jgi:hypothetical protein
MKRTWTIIGVADVPQSAILTDITSPSVRSIRPNPFIEPTGSGGLRRWKLRRSLPVFPDERTISGSVGLSERCRYCCKSRTGPKIPRKAADTSAAFRCPDSSVAPGDHQR